MYTAMSAAPAVQTARNVHPTMPDSIVVDRIAKRFGMVTPPDTVRVAPITAEIIPGAFAERTR